MDELLTNGSLEPVSVPSRLYHISIIGWFIREFVPDFHL